MPSSVILAPSGVPRGGHPRGSEALDEGGRGFSITVSGRGREGERGAMLKPRGLSSSEALVGPSDISTTSQDMQLLILRR